LNHKSCFVDYIAPETFCPINAEFSKILTFNAGPCDAFYPIIQNQERSWQKILNTERFCLLNLEPLKVICSIIFNKKRFCSEMLKHKKLFNSLCYVKKVLSIKAELQQIFSSTMLNQKGSIGLHWMWKDLNLLLLSCHLCSERFLEDKPKKWNFTSFIFRLILMVYYW
jgi:hypothetical protein